VSNGWERRLAARCEQVDSQLCAGIDPSPEACALLPDSSVAGLDAGARAARAELLARCIIDAVADVAVAVKFQLAWFEHAGAAGIEALGHCVAAAHDADLLVILDGKRGDVPHSACAYADAWLGHEAASGIGGDALTVNTWTGGDALEQMQEIAAARDCGLYALVHTSNPGAAGLQAVQLADGRPWWHLGAELVDSVGCGAVVPATDPHVLASARELMPRAPLLVPGLGAQGGSPSSLPDSIFEAPPVLGSASRSLLPSTPSTSLDELVAAVRARALRVYHPAG
jgi:orotidine-5'-phosphate decarboxylase